jgi:hypothetical protein
MKRIVVKIGIKNNYRWIYLEDLSKLYYMKMRKRPKLPKYT